MINFKECWLNFQIWYLLAKTHIKGLENYIFKFIIIWVNGICWALRIASVPQIWGFWANIVLWWCWNAFYTSLRGFNVLGNEYTSFICLVFDQLAEIWSFSCFWQSLKCCFYKMKKPPIISNIWHLVVSKIYNFVHNL